MRVGDAVGGFIVEASDWSGSLGRRFVARDLTGMPVFLRVVDGAGEDEQARARFEQEIALLKRVRGAGLLRVVAHGCYDGMAWLAQEHVDGTRLDKALSKGPFPLERAVWVAAELGKVLQVVHDGGIIVRELTPENVMLDTSGQPVILDLGLARTVDGSMVATAAGTRVGDPAYMAPEYVQDAALTPRSDLYGLGALLFEMIVGQPPFTGSLHQVMLRQMSEPAPRLSSMAKVPWPLDELVASMLAKDPADRPESAAQVVRALTGR